MKNIPVAPPANVELTAPQITPNAKKVLETRYVARDAEGKTTEEPEDVYRRVAWAIASTEAKQGWISRKRDLTELYANFHDLMATGKFLPNTPCLMNAGRNGKLGLSACFVLALDDDRESIMKCAKDICDIQAGGGGTGIPLDRLRPTGDIVSSTGGRAGGPILFWGVLNAVTDAISQGGKRRGANMGMMNVFAVDILKFLFAKQDLALFNSYNISVKIPEWFMYELRKKPENPLRVVNPRNHAEYYLPHRLIDVCRKAAEVSANGIHDYKLINSCYSLDDLFPVEDGTPQEQVITVADIWEIIVQNAWQTGEPGLCFIDRVNNDFPLPIEIEATNPCGETPLPPNGACVLGSINVSAFVFEDANGIPQIDWDALHQCTLDATRFLDNVVSTSSWATPEIAKVTAVTRDIGLGIMGLADLFYKLRIKYGSGESFDLAEKIMQFIQETSHEASEWLGENRGYYGAYNEYKDEGAPRRRNIRITTVAPTGTISILAGCSGGVEPLFALVFDRNIMKEREDSKPLLEINPVFQEVLRQEGLLTDEVLIEVSKNQSLRDVESIPQQIKDVFLTTADITADQHVMMQAAVQKFTDNAVSKTANLDKDCEPGAVDRAYQLAYDLGCKGITIYRDGSRSSQPMSMGNRVEDLSKSRQIDPDPTPRFTASIKLRQTSPFGNLHIHVSIDPQQDRELEVFAQLGKGGEIAAADLEAICRLSSLYLRSGGSLKYIIRQLSGISSTLQLPSKDGKIGSLADALAKALSRYAIAKEKFGVKALLLGESTLSADELDKLETAGQFGGSNQADDAFELRCPECGNRLVVSEGKCVKCYACSYSAC